MLDRAVIHIGFTKTGSSSIQETAHRSRRELLECGVIYPGDFRNHFHLEGAFSDNPKPKRFYARHGRSSEEVKVLTRQKLAGIRAEIAATKARTAIFSHEEFVTMPAEDFGRLVAFGREIADDLTVVCYVRHPAEHAISALQERVKTGQRTLDRFDPARHLSRFTGPLARVKAIVDPQELELRVFERDRLYRQDVVDDFFRLAGLDDASIATLNRWTKNESVCQEVMLLMDALNRVQPLFIDGKPNPERYKRSMDSVFSIRGLPFSIPAPLAAAVIEAAQPQLAELDATHGLVFSDPKLTDPAVEPWQARTLEDLAKLLNDLLQKAYRLEELEKGAGGSGADGGATGR